MRTTVVFFLNGKRHEVGSDQAFQTVSDFLRYERGLTGTKVVCAEGDCGACTVLVSRFRAGKLQPYQSINSCIAYVYSLHRTHLITVEGLKRGQELHPVQAAMVERQGSQCGYCTPGFVCSMALLAEDAKREGFRPDEKKVRNYTTGNLCRCTGYAPILEAGVAMDLDRVQALSSFYGDDRIEAEFSAIRVEGIRIRGEGKEVFLPIDLTEAVQERASDPTVRLSAGTTDLGVVSNKGKLKLTRLLSLQEVESLHLIKKTGNRIRVGARASLHQLERSLADEFPEFSRMLRIFASPQIKNSATLVGNLMNASPIADTIPFLRVAEVLVLIASPQGERRVGINDFILPGYKKLDLRSDELVVGIEIPLSDHRYKLYKVSNRKDLDISAVTFAARYRLKDGAFESFSLALGGVGASVLRMGGIEAQVLGKPLSLNLFRALANTLPGEITPITDVRGSAGYRLRVAQNLLLKFHDDLAVEEGLGINEASL
ncbi:MAG: FAD binding domain-containing protein [Bdellovibrionales bacterium]|nr:FAD binding domain-containing protein [Bdellovibrionales bacterium]